ncbi:MAG: right-handed parallel beta-helix repeat-containing protein, partial [Thermoplasmatales archaeon]|nr:right-handed parallel beta-helix repeat-containing protein [Thermoplasmatales archaeon]
MKYNIRIKTIFFSFVLISATFTGVLSVSNQSIKDELLFTDLIAHDQNSRIVNIPFSKVTQIGELIDYDLTIIDIKNSNITAYASDLEIEKLSELGFEPEILFEDFAEMMGWNDNPEKYDFHDYNSLTTELQSIASNYPSITNLYSLGQSVQGRTIWGLKITDNPNIEENEPEVRICGCHHGNELMSVELPLLLAWLLVENYSINPDITDLIDNREIWIIPLVNPDGRMLVQRRNANNVDLNRDYGYMWDGSGGSPSPFSQPETQVIRDHALENNFVLSLSFHTTAAYVNYLWNYKPQLTPDNDLIVLLSNQYATSSGYTAINGYVWYQTRGDTNDFSYGCRGDIDWTIETGNSNIAYSWNKNRDAMIDIIDAADMGLTGTVTDASTGQPIAATIWVEEVNWPCFTDPIVGDYHKPLLPDTYTVHFRANGYVEQVHSIQVLSMSDPTELNIALMPGEDYYAYQVTMCNYYDPYSYPNNFQNNPTEAVSALGPPDNIFASLGVGGMIVLDMGENDEIQNILGDDFTVFEGDANPDGYDVYASETWNGPWALIGSGTGTSSFDLEDGSLENARFIKIQDDSSGSPYESNPGFDLDAIQALNLSVINTIYVDDNADPSWYDATHVRTIQEGINNASAGTTVFVYSGTYIENVVIDKTINLTGEDRNNVNVSCPGTFDEIAINITADHVNISEFNIENIWSYGHTGIRICGNRSNIYENRFFGNGGDGITIFGSHNSIRNNLFDNNGDGIGIGDDCSNNMINSNLIENSSDDGIYGGNGNHIIGNSIVYNFDKGIYLNGKINNLIYHNNFINNGQHVYDNSINTWYNTTLQEGNYYDDYTGPDGDGDGIGDTPYNIPGGSNQDLYPFMYPLKRIVFLNGWNQIAIPVENSLYGMASSLGEN